MTHTEMLLTIAIVSFATMMTRFIPFIVFPSKKTPPPFIQYLGTVLPAAVMGLLAVYAFKSTTVWAYPYALPEIIATTLLIIVHLRKRNFLLSITVGTLTYMGCLALL